ncbi:hypothetical protein NDU88_002823 [Pleurodeles waltl]|uniref:Uncharacterized protein n=1 Tax=Pleurodeles waltl TaxID=8319 RepID=A0AAV7UE51_PLEWA|nr:hypothetical protein NDU88_002823 [Pleurodeles waltl]
MTGFRQLCFWTSWATGGAEWRSGEESPQVLGRLRAWAPWAPLRAPWAPLGSCGCDEVVVLDLFAKTPAKKTPSGEPPLEEGGDTGEQGESVEGEAPLTRSFMEQLFRALHRDFATLKQEIAAEVKELKREVVELEQ